MKQEAAIAYQLSKNQLVFERKLLNNEVFRTKLLSTIKTYNPLKLSYNEIQYPLKEKNINETRVDTVLKNFNKSLILFEKTQEIVEDLSNEDSQYFGDDLRDLLKIGQFGAEWIDTLATTIIYRWFFPPMYNLHITIQGDITRKRVVLKLNPDTSLKDIEAAWGYIKNLQQGGWPGYSKTNFSKKILSNFKIAAADKELSSTEPNLNDLDKAGKIWKNVEDDSFNADSKRSTNLRKIRGRNKKKM